MKLTKLAALTAASALALSSGAAAIPPENASEYAAYFNQEADICAIFYAGPEGFFLGFNEDYTFLETSGKTATATCQVDLVTPPPAENLNLTRVCGWQYRDGTIQEGEAKLIINKNGKARSICTLNRTQEIEFIEVE